MKATTLLLAVVLTLTVACQPAPTAVPPTATSQKPSQVLLIAKDTSLEVMLTNEVGVMVRMLQAAGFKVLVATPSGKPIVAGAATLTPDLRLADVKVEDYVGVIVPCMANIEAPPEAVAIVANAVALGKPVAAQTSGVMILSEAGVLKGKEFATNNGRAARIHDGTFKGLGVVQDGNLITAGNCPLTARTTTEPETTEALTQRFIDALALLH